MAYFENEILHDLNLGDDYTEKQLVIFAVENADVLIISESCSQFSDYSTKKHKVLKILNGYVHHGEHNAY